MRKISVIAAVVFLLALGLSSCKSTQDCPAYSSVDTEQTTQNVQQRFFVLQLVDFLIAIKCDCFNFMVSYWSDLTPFGKYASQANQYYWFA